MQNRIKKAVSLVLLAGAVSFLGKEQTNAFYAGYDEINNLL